MSSFTNIVYYVFVQDNLNTRTFIILRSVLYDSETWCVILNVLGDKVFGTVVVREGSDGRLGKVT